MTEQQPQKFCSDCKFYGVQHGVAHCFHPQSSQGQSIIDRVETFSRCVDVRKIRGSCGPDATLFEFKPEPEPSLFWPLFFVTALVFGVIIGAGFAAEHMVHSGVLK